MEPFILEHDIPLVCLKAASFPDGVLAAHQQLHARVAFTTQRRYYGISFPGADGTIMYRAAAEVLDASDTVKGLEPFLLHKGSYISIFITGFMDNIPAIGQAFTELLQDPRIDPQGECVEWYIDNKDVRCMVRLKEI